MNEKKSRGRIKNIQDFHKDPGLFFGAADYFIYRINSDKSVRICFGQIGHKLGIFIFIYNRDNFHPGLIVIGSKTLINGSAAVKVIDNEATDLILFLGNDAHSLFQIQAEYKVIQNKTV